MPLRTGAQRGIHDAVGALEGESRPNLARSQAEMGFRHHPRPWMPVPRTAQDRARNLVEQRGWTEAITEIREATGYSRRDARCIALALMYGWKIPAPMPGDPGAVDHAAPSTPQIDHHGTPRRAVNMWLWPEFHEGSGRRSGGGGDAAAPS